MVACNLTHNRGEPLKERSCIMYAKLEYPDVLNSHSRKTQQPPAPIERSARAPDKRPSPAGAGHPCHAAVRLLLGLILLALGSNAAIAQGSLTNGWTHTGTISPAGDADSWTFSASIGDRIVLRVGEITQTGTFTPRIRLQTPTAVQQAIASSAVAVEIAVTATNSGTFTVIVDDAVGTTATGTYRLTLARVPGAILVAPGDEGGPMTNGVAHQGDLPPGDLDVWGFTANAGDSLVVKVGQITQTNNFDPWVRLYGPDGNLLGSSAAATAAEVATRATNSGTFLVVIANDPYYTDAASGTYLLTLAKTGSPIVVSADDEGGPMTNGVAHLGNMPIGDLDLWNFTANAGDNLVLRVGQMSDTNSFDPWVRLYGPDGALLASDDAAAAAEVAFRATNSGTFLVVTANHPYYSDAASGTYLLTLAKTGSPIVVSPGDEGGSMTNGVAHVGNMPIGDLDLWNFPANSGDNLMVRVGQITETSNFYPWVRLYGPDGALLAEETRASAAEVAFRATNSGTFLVVIANYPYVSDAAIGTYLLTLAKTGSPIVVSPGDEGGPMTNGVAHAGNMPIGDLDLWNFTANAGDNLVLRVGQITETNNFAPWVRLYGPNGALLGSDWGAAVGEIALRATNSGTFLVVIANYPYYSDAASGTYILTLARTGILLVISPGDEGGALSGAGVYNGTLTIGDMDSWTFTSCAGDFIDLRATQITETNAFAPWVRLYGPNGALIGSSFGAVFGEVALRATNSGTFLVVVCNSDYYNNAGSGAYQLTANGLSDGLKLCLPIISGANLNLAGVGGVSNATYFLFTQTNVATPAASWTPIRTNQFDSLGVFQHTNVYDPDEPARFFLLLEQL
jgi:trimeric autotransporter adhesin